jgi:DNA-binding transcriptional LysR family regulator
VAEFVALQLKRAAVILADCLDYGRAAKTMGTSETELREQISVLEDLLCVRLFESESQRPVLTREGRFLIQEMRAALAQLDQRDLGDQNEGGEPR